jgi:hypothetical protein
VKKEKSLEKKKSLEEKKSTTDLRDKEIADSEKKMFDFFESRDHIFVDVFFFSL